MTPSEARIRVRQVWSMPAGSLRATMRESVLAEVLEHIAAGCPEELAQKLAEIALEARRGVDCEPTPLMDDAQRYTGRGVR